MRRACSTMLACLALGACTAPNMPISALSPRAAEAIDPRAPIDRPVVAGPADPALERQLADLMAEVRRGDAQFQAAAERAERLATGAGEPRSDSWVEAQQAVSAAIAARAPTTRAMGDIDAAAALRLQTSGGIPPGDLRAIEAAAAEASAIDRRQAERIDALERRLGR